MKKNEGQLDRFLRGFVSAILFIVGFFRTGGILSIILLVLSTIFALTAIIGFCGIYGPCHINTTKKTINKKTKIGLSILLILVVGGGSFLSAFFTKKLFIEDFAEVNNIYKQLLFNSGKERREISIKNYEKLIPLYQNFETTYRTYKPFAILRDTQFNKDIAGIGKTLVGMKTEIYSGDLAATHKKLEDVRAIFQDILKRNGFSLLTVALVDFHDVMEVLVEAADAKDTAKIIETYPAANEKLVDVETYSTSEGIKRIRAELETLVQLAQVKETESLKDQGQKLKASFIQVYLKN